MNVISYGLQLAFRKTFFFSLLFVLPFSFNAFSQKEANNWYFGEYAGITFNGDTVKSLTNGKLTTLEGCATISDKSGKLLFYTDGITIWDKDHSMMASGLLGNWTSSQSAIIVPRPGIALQYYVFTVGYEADSNGVNYSEIDLSLNSGNGGIVSGRKNIKLLSPTCEKLTAVLHSNGKDYWVLTHKYDSDTIYAWLVTSSGVSPMPVKSVTGLKVTTPIKTVGYMKLSPDGKKIAYANYAMDTCCIGDFNAITGKISNVWSFKTLGAYGIEFSATGKFLYVAEPFKNRIYQLDAKATSMVDFLSSKTLVDSINRGSIGSLQIGPDKKIYISRISSKYLDVIHAPDSSGKDCRVQYDYINLLGKGCLFGFPNFIASYFSLRILNDGACYGDTTWFAISFSNEADSVHWIFGDTASKKMNNAKGIKVYHLFSDTGLYKVRSVAFKGTKSDTAYLDVQLLTIPQVTLGKDTIVCEKTSLILSVANPQNDETYFWSTFETTPIIKITDQGKYWVRAKNYCGDDTSSISVELYQKPEVNLGKDRSLCSNSVGVILNARNYTPFTKYLWGSSNITQTDTAKTSGIYWVRVSNPCGSVMDTIELKFLAQPKVVLSQTILFCDSQSLEFNIANPQNSETYLWSTSDTIPVISITKPGKYWVKAMNYCGEDSVNFDVILYPKPIPKFSTLTDVCEGENFHFNNQSIGGKKFEWRFGDGNTSTDSLTQHQYTITQKSRTYLVTLVVKISEGCQDSVTKPVNVQATSDAGFTHYSNGNTVYFNQTTSDQNNSYKWFFGDGDSAATINPIHQYKADSGSYNVCLNILNAAGCQSQVCKLVHFSIGINEIRKNHFTVYPNPTEGELHIVFDKPGTYKIRVMDVLGRVIFTGLTKQPDYIIHLPAIAKGSYFIKVADEDSVSGQKVVLVR
jgi:PKD repeat protein